MIKKNPKSAKKLFKVLAKGGIVFIAIFLIMGIWFFFNAGGLTLKQKASAAVCVRPVDVMLVIDSSGSMLDNDKLNNTKTAAKNFVDMLNLSAALPNGDQAGLVSFSTFADTQKNLTQDGGGIKDKIDSLFAGGQTNLKDAIEKAAIELNSSRHNSSADKIMIVLSDGAPNRPLPESQAALEAENAATGAKNNNIRIITIGLDIAADAAAQQTLTNIASAPSDFYQVADSDILTVIYNTISQSLCDTIPPTIVSLSRNPSGTVYSRDSIEIKSKVSDDFGISHNFIKWTADNWVTTNSSNDSNCDALRNNCQITIGPFASGANIKYKIEAADTNNNAVASSIYSFTAAALTIASSNFLRNTFNFVAAAVNDPDGNLIVENSKFYISLESPEGSGVYKIDKALMLCTGTAAAKTCSYSINPDCTWTDSTAKIYIYPYDDYYGAYHNPPSTKSVAIGNPIESGITLCGNCIDDDCNGKWDLANYAGNCGIMPYDVSKAEKNCDNIAPTLLISRTPLESQNVYETDNLIINSMAAENPPLLNALVNHKIKYRVNGGSPIIAFNCSDSNADGYCDSDIAQSIANISVNLGQFAAGTNIEYYSEATDTAVSPNTGFSLTRTVTIAYRECYDDTGTQKPPLTSCTGGKCCAGVCNTARSCSLDNSCSKDSCSGTIWTCAPDNVGMAPCSTNSGNTDGCYVYSATGCEIRNYFCQSSGICDYPAPGIRRTDACSGNFYNDYGCANGCGSTPINSYDCSGKLNQSPANNNTGIACNCQCNGYDAEENLANNNCSDGKDNDCDGLIDSQEAACDNKLDSIAISRTPLGAVYDSDTITFTSSAADSFGIAQHIIEWNQNSGVWSSKDCGVSAACALAIGPFSSGTVIKYKSKAKDNNGNWGYTSEYSFTVLSLECAGKPDLTSCAGGGGRCCGEFCDIFRDCSFASDCSKDKCSGISWICEADLAKNGLSCGMGTSCYSYNTAGCEDRNYQCGNGYCNYTYSNRQEDVCSGSTLLDYNCGISCSFSSVACSSAGAINGCSCACAGRGRVEKFYNAASLDGVDDYVDLGNILSPASNPFSVEIWFKWNGKSGENILYNKENLYEARVNEGYFQYAWQPHWNWDGGSSFPVAAGAWYHATVVYDKAYQYVYKNGNLVYSRSQSGDIGSNTYKLLIGAHGGASPYNFFGGLISEVRVYNRALSPTEIAQHYTGEYLNNNSLVGLWHLDGNANDDSGASPVHNGVLNLGGGGNTNPANAWLSARTDVNNVPLPWRVCSDTIDNDCNGLIDAQEINCDNIPPAISIARTPPGVVYNANAITLISTATDSSAIQSHKIKWTRDNWSTFTEQNCSSSGSCSVAIGPFSASAVIKYKSEAADTNGNFIETPVYEFTVNDLCYGQPDGVGCAGGNGICCGGFCDSSHWRKPIVISGSTAGAVSDYQIKFNISYDSRMKSDFGDVYFTGSNGITILSFWRESYIFATSAAFWVKVPAIPAFPGTEVIYMHYGSPVISSLSNSKSTFELFEDWESGAIAADWTKGGSAAPYWNINSAIKNDGNYSVSSAPINNSQVVWIKRNISLSADSKLEYYWNVDSEKSYDYLYLCVNNDSCSRSSGYIYRISGNTTNGYTSNTPVSYAGGWQSVNYNLGAGNNSIRFSYEKDGSVAVGRDQGLFDSVRVRKFINPEPTYSISAAEEKRLNDDDGYSYSSECSQVSCSPQISSVWTRTPANEGISCSAGSDGCYAWPESGYGCEIRAYACSSGLCNYSSSNQNIDSCSGNSYNDYGCANGCGSTPINSYDCSGKLNQSPANNNTGIACNCQCNGYDAEEKLYGALKLDGVDDYVNAGNIGKIKTISYWVKTAANNFCAIPYSGSKYYKDGVIANLFGSELIINGNFNSNIIGWTADNPGASPVSWQNAVSGDGGIGYLRFSIAANTNWDRFKSDSSVAIANTAYKISFWYRTSGITGNLRALFADNFGSLANHVQSIDIIPSTDWKFTSFVLKTSSLSYPIFTIVKTGNIGAGVFDIDGISVKSLNTGIDSGWHHIAVTSDNDVYASNMTIGKFQNTSGFFNGIIDEVRIYNRALSQTEIVQYYNGEYFNNAGLMALWNFDGNANDSSGNGNNGVLNLGTSGNTNIGNAWISALSDVNNVPLPWRVCSDNKDNNCNGRIDLVNGLEELSCDNIFPIVTLTAKDKNGVVIPDSGLIYDIDIDNPSEKITFSSVASDNLGIQIHKILWTKDNWINTNVIDCLSDNCSSYKINGGQFPAGTVVRYKAYAIDNNSNKSCLPTDCNNDYSFTIAAYNTSPAVTPLSITQPGDYCKIGPNLKVTWSYFDAEGDKQSAYQIEIDDESTFTTPVYNSGVVSGSSNSYSISSGLQYNTAYYWRVKVWDARGLASSGSGGVCGEWKCDLGQWTTTPLHAYPTVDFSWSPASPKALETVQFNNNSTPSADVAWEWDLNSPSNKCGRDDYEVTLSNRDSTEKNPTYIYPEPVFYAVGLKVTDSDAYSCQLQKCISIGRKLPMWKEIIPK